MADYISLEKEVVFTDERTHAWRWRIKHNPDFPGTLDIIYEEISETTRKFEPRELFTGMSIKLAETLIASLDIMIPDARHQLEVHGND